MVEQDYKNRLKKEFNDLEYKIQNLEAFLHSKAVDKVIKIQRSLLIVQLDAMKTYSTCLHERLDNLD